MTVQAAAQRTAGATTHPSAMADRVGPMVAGLGLLLLLLGLILPAVRGPRPHDIPVGLVGPSAATAQIQQGFATAAPGAFRFVGYGSEDEGRRAVGAREVNGLLIVRPGAPVLVVAGAAGDGSSAAIAGAIGNALRAQGANPTVETVRPFSSADPHGLILFFLVLALTISALAAAVATATRTAGNAALLATATFAVLAGLVGSWTVELMVGGYGTQVWLVAALGALGAGAVGLAIVGAARAFGTLGAGLATVVLGPVNLITSGGPIGSDFLPDAYRALSPFMPAAEMYSAFRGALFFDGAGVASQVAALSAWAVAGVAVAIAADLVDQRRSQRLAA